MRVRCPNCGTEFHLDDDRIPENGLRARCGVCKHVVSVPSPSAVGPDDPVFMTTQGTPQPPALAHLPKDDDPTTAEEAASLMIEVAREQRAMAWQLTQEIFRLREAIDQQHSVLDALVKLLSTQPGVPAAPRNGESAEDSAVRELQEALESEREIVEQLKQSRGELEERAAKAEEALSKRGPSGLFDKFLRRRY